MTASLTPSTVRAARAEDRDTILDLARASALFPPEELVEVATVLDTFLAGAAGDARWIVDETGVGATAAAAYYSPEPMTRGSWNLHMLVVHPDHHHRGRGSALVRHVEQVLRRSGARVLLIETSGVAEFAGQRAFYVGLGYQQEARIRDFYAAGDDKVVYWKRLRSLPPATSTGGRSPRRP